MGHTPSPRQALAAMLLILTACQSTAPTAAPTRASPPPADPPTDAPTVTPSPTLTRTPIPRPTHPTETPGPPSIGESPPPVDLPPGLLVLGGDPNAGLGLWVLDESGQMQQYPTDQMWYFDLSPDGTKLLYTIRDRDVWVYDLLTREARNVTNNLDRWERVPRWWPNRNGFVAGSFAEGEGGQHFGYLTYVGFDGTYRVLDDTRLMWGNPAPSPDGRTIAYGLCCTLQEGDVSNVRLYREGIGVQQLHMDVYGVQATITSGLGWSPDGRALAAVTLRPNETNEYSIAEIVLIDMAAGGSRVLMEFRPAPGDAAYVGSIPVWSPDGSLMAFFLELSEWTQPSIWAADEDKVWPISPQPEGLFWETGEPLWYGQPAFSPDGEWIAVPLNYQGARGVGLIRTSDWQTFEWPMAGLVAQVEWADLP